MGRGSGLFDACLLFLLLCIGPPCNHVNKSVLLPFPTVPCYTRIYLTSLCTTMYSMYIYNVRWRGTWPLRDERKREPTPLDIIISNSQHPFCLIPCYSIIFPSLLPFPLHSSALLLIFLLYYWTDTHSLTWRSNPFKNYNAELERMRLQQAYIDVHWPNLWYEICHVEEEVEQKGYVVVQRQKRCIDDFLLED